MKVQRQAEQALQAERQGDPARALRELEALLQSHPDSLFALLHSARLNLSAGDRERSLSRLRHAFSLPEAKVEHWMAMSSLFVMHDCLREAIRSVDRAAERDSANPDVWGQMVAVAREARDSARVRRACERLLALDGDHEAAAVMLAELDAEAGAFEAAEQRYRSVLARNPHHTGAIAGLSKCRRVGRDDDILSVMDAVNDGRLDVAGKARVRFARAKVLNDLERYADAWREAEEANRLKRQISTFDRDRTRQQKNLVIESVDRALKDDVGSANDREHLLIVGMPRSGTTLVEQMLAGHPGYYPGGEVPAFERAMAATPGGGAVLRHLADGKPFDLDRLARQYEAYFREFANFAGDRIINKVPTNFFYIGLFKLMFPRGKVINVRRHPLDVATSIFFENFGTRFGYTTRLDDIFFFFELYQELMGEWRTRFGDSILELDYEGMVTDPRTSRARLFDFLGTEDHGIQHETAANPVETPSVWQTRQPLYVTAINRWKRYEPFLKDYLAYDADRERME